MPDGSPASGPTGWTWARALGVSRSCVPWPPALAGPLIVFETLSALAYYDNNLAADADDALADATNVAVMSLAGWRRA